MEYLGEKDSQNVTENRRRDQRKEFSYIVIEFVMHPDTTYEIYVGHTLNLSETGMCVYTSASVSPGQEIILKSDEPRLFRKAVVRWVDRYDAITYKMGLEFL
jgi:hypothetical protein